MANQKLWIAIEPHLSEVFCVSFYTILAEVCYYLAERLMSYKTQRALVKEGFRYLGLADPKMKDKDGNVTKSIPYKYYEHVYSELCNFDDSKEPIKHKVER